MQIKPLLLTFLCCLTAFFVTAQQVDTAKENPTIRRLGQLVRRDV
jgi:hypothetical protein